MNCERKKVFLCVCICLTTQESNCLLSALHLSQTITDLGFRFHFTFFPSFFLQAEFESQLKSCDAIIVMYSLTDRVSFHVAREILDDLANLQNITCPVILLANKMDLCHHRKVIHSV